MITFCGEDGDTIMTFRKLKQNQINIPMSIILSYSVAPKMVVLFV